MSITARAVFAALDALPLRRFEELGLRRITIVAPHPDDESIGCGGLIRLARDAGVPVSIVIVSDGVGSHPGSVAYPPERLRAVREAEAIEAAQILGVAAGDVHFLREPDRFVPQSGPAVDALTRIMSGSDFVAVAWHEDPHCDHKASFRLAQAACRAAGVRLHAYPVWAMALPPEAPMEAIPERGFRLDISSARDTRRRAIAAHLSQTTSLIADDPQGFRLTARHLALFDRPVETYIEVTA